LVGFQVGRQGIVDGVDGVVAAFFEGEEDAHEDGLDVGAALAAVAVAVFAKDDRRRKR